MPRQIESDHDYKDKLISIIPGEVVAAYLFLQGIIAGGESSQIRGMNLSNWEEWGVFVVLLVLTPIYLVKIHKVHHAVQLAVTTLSFPVWVYTLGGPFKLLGWYEPTLASIILVLWTLVVPLFVNVTAEQEQDPSA